MADLIVIKYDDMHKAEETRIKLQKLQRDYLVDLEYEKGMPYSDILRLAMKREEKALELYNELLEKTDEKSLTKVFKMLCQEEAKHKLKLETLYDDHMAELGD